MKPPVIKDTGSVILQKPLVITGIFALSVVFAYLIGTYGIALGGMLISAIIFIVYFTIQVKYPQLGLYTAIAVGFVLLGSTRYFKTDLPIGMLMDALLVLTFLALFFHHFPRRIDWSPARNLATLLAFIWLMYCLLQIANPEARSTAAWFSAVRPLAFYHFFFVVLALMFLTTPQRIRMIFIVWGIFSILGTLKGAMQLWIGVDPYEKAWLDGGGAITHVLFGRLRVFSFYSDAGQFGANQAYTGAVFTMIALAAKNKKDKIFFWIVALAGFYGMFISGTRGSLFVPFAAFALYFFQRKNIYVLTSGMFFVVLIFIFFKYTTIGQGNYQINRMRTAFNPDDPSLQVRLENQRKLKVYMATRPFGGGLGHGGVKAQKYTPNAFLANVPTDSWYVLIWVETGIIGLILHLAIQFITLGLASYYLMFRLRDPILISQMSALSSGMLGIMLASYGNAIIGQLPTSPLIYTSMGLLLNSLTVDKYIRIKLRKKNLSDRYKNRMHKCKRLSKAA
ncbi:MAG: O-antigen ligase family protein [Bacteroidales bacterium]